MPSSDDESLYLRDGSVIWNNGIDDFPGWKMDVLNDFSTIMKVDRDILNNEVVGPTDENAAELAEGNANDMQMCGLCKAKTSWTADNDVWITPATQRLFIKSREKVAHKYLSKHIQAGSDMHTTVVNTGVDNVRQIWPKFMQEYGIHDEPERTPDHSC